MKSIVLVCRGVSQGPFGLRVQFSCVRSLSEIFDEVRLLNGNLNENDNLISDDFKFFLPVVVDGLALCIEFSYCSDSKSFVYKSIDYLLSGSLYRDVLIIRCLYDFICLGDYRPTIGINEVHEASVDFDDAVKQPSLRYFFPRRYRFSYSFADQFKKKIMQK